MTIDCLKVASGGQNVSKDEDEEGGDKKDEGSGFDRLWDVTMNG